MPIKLRPLRPRIAWQNCRNVFGEGEEIKRTGLHYAPHLRYKNKKLGVCEINCGLNCKALNHFTNKPSKNVCNFKWY